MNALPSVQVTQIHCFEYLKLVIRTRTYFSIIIKYTGDVNRLQYVNQLYVI